MSSLTTSSLALFQARSAQLEALFDHVGRKLLHSQRGIVALEVPHDHRGRLGLPELEDVLHHVVSERDPATGAANGTETLDMMSMR